ncbi:DUF262 domain-containing protein [Pantoea ananatis]|uniref:DUF262 domain-containing protein n=1 Tax=Pantoea ananas TaxID=553 RepID=UPI0011A55AE6|nr:DUF262 domain-containing protein [Pantoea ananatis]
MHVRPQYKSFGELFRENNIFFTPFYQRDYSWEDEQINQFCTDIKYALNKKQNDQACDHFFGGVVCAQKQGIGTRKIENLLVDGQQRLSTITLFFSAVKETLEKIKCDEDDDRFKSEILKDIYKYFYFDERENRETIKNRRMKIGQADNDFYNSLMDSKVIEATRDSHRLMREAKTTFLDFFEKDLLIAKRPSESLDVIDEIVKLFDEKFLLIHIITTNVDDAHKLFTVLNDRGVSLTEGELLKAYTIGLCNNSSSCIEQISSDWDIILKYTPKKVSDFLRWIIIMISGDNVTTSSVLQKYKEFYFPEKTSPIDIAYKVKFMRVCVEKLQYIYDGEWPYDESNTTTNWHKNKLDLLIRKLKHTHAMPVLLAASFACESEFQNLVNETCKFFIRYKAISTLHATIFSTIYPELAREIYQLKDSFTIKIAQTKFNDILKVKDPDDTYLSIGIRNLRYQRKGDNKPLKCLLITIEENWQWLCSENLTCSNRLQLEDKTRIFDFNNTCLEHLYPENAGKNFRDENMEKIKNSIGNIVIADGARSIGGDDKPFFEKRKIFINTGIGSHKCIIEKKEWTVDNIKSLTEKYIEYACKVFSFR